MRPDHYFQFSFKLNPDLNRRIPQQALPFRSRVPLQGEADTPQGASPRRSCCHRSGLGLSATLQPLPTPAAFSLGHCPTGSSAQPGDASAQALPHRFPPGIPVGGDAGVYLGCSAYICLCASSQRVEAGTYVRNGQSSPQLQPLSSAGPVKVLPGSRAAVQGFLPAP